MGTLLALLKVALIPAVPFATADTMPVELTVATDVFWDDHVTLEVMSCCVVGSEPA